MRRRVPRRYEARIFTNDLRKLPAAIARENIKTAALDLALERERRQLGQRERQAHEAGARTRATVHERTPPQERQKAAREVERDREAGR